MTRLDFRLLQYCRQGRKIEIGFEIHVALADPARGAVDRIAVHTPARHAGYADNPHHFCIGYMTGVIGAGTGLTG